MSQTAVAGSPPTGWIRGATFDQAFILGTAGVALAAAALVAGRPELFGLVLLLNLWLLGYHHVIATFTRVAMDRESFREHRFFVLGLPWLVLGGVLALWFGLGAWSITTVYFYWQWFHYTRQSYGVERIYWRSAKRPGAEDPLTWYVLYGVALWGMLARSAQGSATGMTFLTADVAWLPVPWWLAHGVGVAAIGGLAVWAARRVRELMAGELRVAHTLYVASHIVVFTAGYLVFDQVDHGWLAVNIWHNAQYLVVVWLFNTNRFKAGVDPSARLLSEISQPGAALRYVAVTLSLTALLYLPLAGLQAWLATYGIAAAVVIYQTVNFHHYVVDSFIWKLRKKRVRAQLVDG